ncbi:MAG: hypothetical protein QMD02_02670 [Bacteroidales bacterium]|nr:hypothetical protein [Bacteroidales bacterium]
MDSVISFLFKNFYLLIIGATKFMFTTTTAKISGLNFYEAFSVTALGGIIGYFFFYYLFDGVIRLYNIISNHYKNPNKPPKPKKNVPYKKRKKYVKWVRHYGYWGLIVFTPCFISIPLGAFLLRRYFPHKGGKDLIVSFAIVIWASIYTFALYFNEMLNIL